MTKKSILQKYIESAKSKYALRNPTANQLHRLLYYYNIRSQLVEGLVSSMIFARLLKLTRQKEFHDVEEYRV